MNIKTFTPDARPSEAEKSDIIQFLYHSLDQYGDKKSAIQKAMEYSLKETDSPGGFVIAGYENEEVVGAVIVNETGMAEYIPENILVYIAVSGDHRGKGFGKQLMQKALETANGSIALHVEPDNPARFLYEKLGFTNKYLEMRYQKV